MQTLYQRPHLHVLKLGTLIAKIKNLDQAIERDSQRFAGGIPSMLLQAPPIKTPQTTEYGKEFYAKSNAIVLKASIKLSRHCIDEMHAIQRKNAQEYDDTLAEMKPRVLSRAEWGTIFKLAGNRTNKVPYAPTDRTDPHSLQFLVAPDVERRQKYRKNHKNTKTGHNNSRKIQKILIITISLLPLSPTRKIQFKL